MIDRGASPNFRPGYHELFITPRGDVTLDLIDPATEERSDVDAIEWHDAAGNLEFGGEFTISNIEEGLAAAQVAWKIGLGRPIGASRLCGGRPCNEPAWIKIDPGTERVMKKQGSPDRAAPGSILNVPAYFLYGEDWTQAVFGFFHIESHAVRNVPNQWRIGLHRHPDFDQLSFQFSGRCTFEHDGQQFAADAPSCVYTPANVVHQFAYEPGGTGFVISVSSDFTAGLASVEEAASAAMLRLATRRIIPLPSEKSVATTRSLIDLLHENVGSVHRSRRDMLRYLFAALLLELNSSVVGTPCGGDQPTSTGAPGLFRRFRDLMLVTIGAIGFADASRLQAHTVETFAAKLSSTPYALNAACQSMCGCPARELIQTAVLEQATRLLLYTDRPVKEISFLLGYSHASHFARFFRQRRGSPPEAFRTRVADGGVFTQATGPPRQAGFRP